MSEPDAIVWVWTGREGENLDGVPARSLTEADVDRLTKEQRADVKASKLYRVPPRRAPQPEVTAGTEEPTTEEGSS